MDKINELAKAVIAKGIETGVMVATAESCTGGLISAALTDVSGSSAVFDRGFVTYSNEAKAAMLGVDYALTQPGGPGAVSAEVARAMAAGAVVNSAATCAVAVTGIAGPGGGSADKPVGLVFIGVHTRGGTREAREFRFADDGAKTRGDVRRMTVKAALDMLREALDQVVSDRP